MLKLVKGMTWVLAILVCLTLVLLWEQWLILEMTSTYISCAPDGTGL